MKFNKKIIIDSLLGLVLGGGIVYFSFTVMSKELLMKFLPDESVFENIIFFTSIFFAPFLSIILHELGHLLAGIIQGFKTELFVVGFLGIKRENNELKFYFNTNVQYFGGVAATSPTKILSDIELINKYRIILVSGPIISLLFGVLAFTIFYVFDSAFTSFLGLLAITSFGIFFATTLPEKTGIFFTDRKRFQRLSDKGKIGQIELAFLQIVNQSLLEGNCKNLSLQNIEKMKSDEEKIVQFWAYYFEFQYFKDNNNLEESENTKSKIYTYKDAIPKSLWKNLQIE